MKPELDKHEQRDADMRRLATMRDEMQRKIAAAPDTPWQAAQSSGPLCILVCGGRHYDNAAHVFTVLDGYRRHAAHDALTIVQGAATGADRLAREWCIQRKVPFHNFPANWQELGNAAGPIRNARMLEAGKPDLVIAFPGGKGTADMVTKARAAGVKVVEVQPTDNSLTSPETMGGDRE